ncbi:MAG: hypothetical protein WBV94_29695 [Blastocatellia bacterium]
MAIKLPGYILLNRALKRTATLVIAVLLLASACLISPAQSAQAPAISKAEFDVIEGVFHDGLGTYAEVLLGNELIALAHLSQAMFDASPSRAKMQDAINRLTVAHPSRAVFQQEIANIERAVKRGAVELLNRASPGKLARVYHTPREYQDAKAGDLRLEFNGRDLLPVSVKTDKSGKVAVAEGQTPDIESKWAERYFKVSRAEMDKMIRELGFDSVAELKTHYLNVARLVAEVLIHKLDLMDCQPTDFSRARVRDLSAAKYLFRQLRHFKRGNDDSRVIIFDRSTGEVKWESLLDEIEIDKLTADRISFLPSRPRSPHEIASEFGLKIDGRTVVSFQIKHRRGRLRGTARQYEFSDITTRLRL